MSTVTILRREPAPGAPPGAPTEHVVAVTYYGPGAPPRTILVPAPHYRPATPDELKATPRYEFLPKGPAGEQAERLAIQQDIEQVLKSAPTSFEVP
jgi:hypothetical protein